MRDYEFTLRELDNIAYLMATHEQARNAQWDAWCDRHVLERIAERKIAEAWHEIDHEQWRMSAPYIGERIQIQK